VSTRQVTVFAQPTPATITGNSVVCTGSSISLNSSVSGGIWGSSNQAVASVNSNGLVSGNGPGTANITYTVSGSNGCSDVVSVFPITVNSISAGVLSGVQNVCVGSTTSFFSTVIGGVWSSGNPSIAIVNPVNGNVTGIASGTVVITYTVSGSSGCGSVSANRVAFVSAAPNSGVLSGSQSLCVGSTTLYTSNVTGGTWSSNNSSVASVNSVTGLVTGVSAGNASIIYTVGGSGGCSDASISRSITVNAGPTPGVLGGSRFICAGSVTQYTSTVSGGSWSSNNTSVASVNASTGVVTGIAPGIATIVYTVLGSGGCSNVTSTRSITINSRPIPPVIAISSNFDTIFSSTSVGVKWYRNGQEILGVAAPFLVISENGTYRAVSVGTNGCPSDSSNSINVSNVSVPEYGFDYLNLFPNPSNGIVWFEYQTFDRHPIKLSVVNSMGQVVRMETMIVQSEGVCRVELDFSTLASGIYNLRLEQPSRLGQLKFIVQK